MNRSYMTCAVAVLASAMVLTGPGVVPAQANQSFRCESHNNRRSVCPIPGGGQVWLSRTLSQSACVQGRTWNYDRRNVWVDDGCRAEFTVGGGGGGGSSNSGVEAAAALAIVGLAIAAAAASGDDNSPPPPPSYGPGYGQGYGQGYGPPPPNYGNPGYGGYPPPPPPRRKGSVPGWMVGNFAGFNAQQRVRINLTIYPDGRAEANVNGAAMPAFIQGQRLMVANTQFDVSPTHNGIITRQVGNPANETHYARR